MIFLYFLMLKSDLYLLHEQYKWREEHNVAIQYVALHNITAVIS